MVRKSLIAAFIVFFGTAFVAMPVASANPLDWIFGGDDEPQPEEPPVDTPSEEPVDNPGEEPTDETGQDEESPEPKPEDSTDDQLIEEPDLPDSPAGQGSQAKSGKSSTQPQSASGNAAASGNGGQLPKTATPYPMMLLVGGLVTAAGLALLRVRPSRS